MLTNWNWSPLSPQKIDYSARVRDRPSQGERSDKGYQFDFDFGRDWVEPLARCFGADAADIESRVSATILSAWGEQFDGKHNEDARWTAGVFRQGETLSRYSDFPRIHTLDSYLTFHALMRVAGQLANTAPSYQDPESDEDDFSQWCNRHDLTRRDGRWLSDRRDPAPADQRELTPRTYNKETWRWSVLPEDFGQYLGLGSSTPIRIWETSERNEKERSQHVDIRSALVQPERASALLGALQSSAGRMDFRIPPAGDELEFDYAGYVLRGWIIDESRIPALDQSDGFSGGVGFPPPRPAHEFQNAIQITPDLDQRRWTRPAGVVGSLLVTSWNDRSRERNGRGLGSSGDRVEIDGPSLDDALEQFEMDLIVAVSIDRATYDHSGRNNDYSSNEIGYLDDYFKVFLYRRHSGWFDARGPLSTG